MRNLLNEQIKNAKDHVIVFSYLGYREYLEDVYQWINKDVGKMSYRQFSQILGFSLTNIIGLIIKGKRPLTCKAALRITNALNLTGKQKTYFEALVAYHNLRDLSKKEDLFKTILSIKTDSLSSEKIKEHLEFYSEWYHSAIFELLALPTSVHEHTWIAKHLNPRIRPEMARESLELMESLGLIRFDQEIKRYVRTDIRVTTGDEIASIALIRYHQKFIEIARESVTGTDSRMRDISSITISIPKDTLPKIKDEISGLRKRLLLLSEQSKDRDSVYQLNLQLFPIINMETDKDEDK